MLVDCGFRGKFDPARRRPPPLSLAASLDFKVFKLSSRDLAYSSIHPPSTRKSHCPENQSGACGREIGCVGGMIEAQEAGDKRGQDWDDDPASKGRGTDWAVFRHFDIVDSKI